MPKTLRSRGSTRRDATRETILSGALRCFARDGGLSATHAAELHLAAAEGIKARGRTTLSARTYQQRLGQAVRIVIAGLARPAAARGNAGARRLGASS